MSLKLFYVYARKDQARRNELDIHLAAAKKRHDIEPWYDRMINPGTDWERAIESKLKSADIILLLVSADFMNSKYCFNKEMRLALEKHEEKTAVIIPILLRPADYEGAPFTSIQMLPMNGEAVSIWKDEDQAYVDVARGISRAIDAWLAERPDLPSTPLVTLPLQTSSLLPAEQVIQPPQSAQVTQSPPMQGIHLSQTGQIPQSLPPGQSISPIQSGQLIQQPPVSQSPQKPDGVFVRIKNVSLPLKIAIIASVLFLCIFLIFGNLMLSLIESLIQPNSHPITPSTQLIINTKIQQVVIEGESIKVGIAPKDQNNIFNTPDNNTSSCIDNENTKIERMKQPFVTAIVVTALSETNNDKSASSEIGKEELQGLCLWQNTYLKSQPKIPVWIVVANLGTKETDVLNGTWEDVNKQIIQFAKDNKNFIGVVGFSFSLSVSNAMDELNMQHIPVVSDAASSSDFSQKDWPYFHRVVPDDYTEGGDDADYAINTLKAQTAYVFSDTDTPQPFGERGNSYSKTLGRAFQDKFERGGGTVIPETYSVSKGGTFVSGINKMLTEMQRNPSVNTASTATHTIIFCACYADDFTQFQQNLQAKQSLQNIVPANAVFMGGEALYELGAFKNNYKNLYFTAFTFPDTDSNPVACPEQQCQGEPEQFYGDYCKMFSPVAPPGGCISPNGSYDTSRPGPHTIQTYDALSALQQAYDKNQTAASREDLQSAFGSLAFQGVSGYIDFTNPGKAPSDPNNKAVLVICVNSSGSTQLLYIYGQFVSGANPAGTPIQSACKQ